METLRVNVVLAEQTQYSRIEVCITQGEDKRNFQMILAPPNGQIKKSEITMEVKTNNKTEKQTFSI